MGLLVRVYSVEAMEELAPEKVEGNSRILLFITEVFKVP